MICWRRFVASALFSSLPSPSFTDADLLFCFVLCRSQQKDNNVYLDLEYVQLNVPKVLALLNKVFGKRK